MRYVFILGNNKDLSVAEISAVVKPSSIVEETSLFLILESEEFDCPRILERLGGTIKIAKVIDEKVSKQAIVDELKNDSEGKKVRFGLSFYNCAKTNLGMDVKKDLKAAGISCRLVTARDKILSSVVVRKNKCQEFLILENRVLAKTCGVQDFEDYGKIDFGRPVRDTLSGTLPPKLAKMMINLAEADFNKILLDPFCGSGTVLQQALLMGYKKVIGSDVSQKAVADSKNNLEWLRNNFNLQGNQFYLHHQDVRYLAQTVEQASFVATEPYLGPPLRGFESKDQLESIISELSSLYVKAFEQFYEILPSGGKVVIVIPGFSHRGEVLQMPILEKISEIGFKKLNKSNLVYSRTGQKVIRNINIFEKN